jgi:Domain of unknown function (DUF4158)
LSALGCQCHSAIDGQRLPHQRRGHYGYSEITEPLVGFRLTRWLYGLCWTGTERPSKLFERATAWLLAHKILLPGCTLERFVVRLRSRVEAKVWRLLGRGITGEQRKRLEYLLTVPEGSRGSWLDKLRSGPTRVSGPALRAAIERLKSVRELGITLPAAARIPESRIAALARFANRAKVTLITRMPAARRLATLAALSTALKRRPRMMFWKYWRSSCTNCSAMPKKQTRRRACGH